MVSATTAFQCEQCGGNASAVPGRDYLQCDYCRSLVFTDRNPLIVDRITPSGGTLDTECPVCSKSLCMGRIEDRPVLYCCGCLGMLLRNDDFGTIVRQRRAQRRSGEGRAVAALNPAEYERQLSCPNCRGSMEVHPYYGPGNIVMDSCHRCQYVWLDHGELRKVEQAEGGREPEVLPLYVNAEGHVTMIPPPETASSGKPGLYREGSPLAALADLLFGF